MMNSMSGSILPPLFKGDLVEMSTGANALLQLSRAGESKLSNVRYGNDVPVMLRNLMASCIQRAAPPAHETAIHSSHVPAHAVSARHAINTDSLEDRTSSTDSIDSKATTDNEGDEKSMATKQALACHVHVVLPRRKAGELDTPERDAVVVTPTVLASLFHLPLAVASQRMGLSATTIKKLCRKVGINKWPYKSPYRPPSSTPSKSSASKMDDTLSSSSTSLAASPRMSPTSAAPVQSQEKLEGLISINSLICDDNQAHSTLPSRPAPTFSFVQPAQVPLSFGNLYPVPTPRCMPGPLSSNSVAASRLSQAINGGVMMGSMGAVLLQH